MNDEGLTRAQVEIVKELMADVERLTRERDALREDATRVIDEYLSKTPIGSRVEEAVYRLKASLKEYAALGQKEPHVAD